MHHRTYSILAIVSAVAAIVAVALWVRSYFTIDTVQRDGPRFTEVDSYGGKLQWVTGRHGDDESIHWQMTSRPFHPSNTTTPTRFGFLFTYIEVIGPPREYARTYVAIVPYWSIVLLLSIAPAVAYRRRRRRAVLAGHCPGCGYDLRATPERCPECGRKTTGRA